MECPYCKKTLELSIAGERPWWKNPGCLVVLLFLTLFVVHSLFFAAQPAATKEDAAKLEQHLQNLERLIGELNQKLAKSPSVPQNKP